MKKYKIIVAHPYQQHSFRTATAIKNIGCLFSYITTVYDKKKSLTSLVKKFLNEDNKNRANNRKCLDLKDEEIIQFCEIESLLLLLLYRVDRTHKLYNLLNTYILKKYNKKLAEFILKNNVDAAILYDTLCSECIRILKEKKAKVKIIVDMSAPNFVYMDTFFKNTIQKHGKMTRFLRNELQSTIYKKRMKCAKYEIENADAFLVASEFTKNSLLYSNIKEKNIYICRYGIDIKDNMIKKKYSEKIRIIFIGDVTQKKGVIDYVNIAKKIGNEKFTFTILGRYYKEDPIYIKNCEFINFRGYVTHNEVLTICENMDIIIFPSLADGFGLSVIEAMSKRVLPIVSKNAGVSDIINNGKNGYIFEPEEIYTVVEICNSFKGNREKLKIMQNMAFDSVTKITWSNYDREIKSAIKSIFRLEE